MSLVSASSEITFSVIFWNKVFYSSCFPWYSMFTLAKFELKNYWLSKMGSSGIWIEGEIIWACWKNGFVTKCCYWWVKVLFIASYLFFSKFVLFWKINWARNSSSEILRCSSLIKGQKSLLINGVRFWLSY